MIYFDNAATSGKKPQCVINAVDNALRYYSANPGRSGHSLAEKGSIAVYRAREKVADFFGAEGAEQVIFTASCTHSANYVLKGVLNRGDHIIVSSLEHNAVIRPIVKQAIEYDVAEVDFEDDGITVEHFGKLIKPNTKMIFCTAASNVVGKLLPIEEIGRLCKERNILFAVDAAQAAGVSEINMERMNIDYLCIAPHKGLYAPMGIGILIARAPIEKTIIQGGTGNNSLSLVQTTQMPEDFESGTVNLPAILGVSAAVDFVKKCTVKNIYKHETTLILRLYKGLLRIKDAVVYTNPQKGGFLPVLSFNIRGIDSAEVAKELNRKGIAVRAGLHCAPMAHKCIGTLDGGTVRVSVSIYNNEREIDYLLSCLKNINKL